MSEANQRGIDPNFRGATALSIRRADRWKGTTAYRANKVAESSLKTIRRYKQYIAPDGTVLVMNVTVVPSGYTRDAVLKRAMFGY